MELYIFGRFEVRAGAEAAFEEALRAVMAATRVGVGMPGGIWLPVGAHDGAVLPALPMEGCGDV